VIHISYTLSQDNVCNGFNGKKKKQKTAHSNSIWLHKLN